MPAISIPSFAQAQLELLLAEHAAEIASSPLAGSPQPKATKGSKEPKESNESKDSNKNKTIPDIPSTTPAAINHALARASPATRRALQTAGHALTSLVLNNVRTGSGGREVGEFGVDAAVGGTTGKGKGRGKGKEMDSNKDKGAGGGAGEDGNAGAAGMPTHGIRVGDVVRVAEVTSGSRGKGRDREKEKDKEQGNDGDGEGKTMLEGVVTRVGDRGVWAAFGDEGLSDMWGKKLWMVKLANDVTYRKMKQTMEQLGRMSESQYTPLMRVLFGHAPPAVVDAAQNVTFFDNTLNDSQKEAVCFALAAPDLALIHGPPGTGKTYTLVELIRQLAACNKRILVCGPSNVSVDNLAERLSRHGIGLPIVRLGHPARFLPAVADVSLDAQTATSDAGGIIRDVRAEMEARMRSLRKTRSGRERRAIYADLRELRRELRAREARCSTDLVGASTVVLATLHGAGGRHAVAPGQRFDVVVIDEASQALEAQCWVALLAAGAPKVVLAGDHLQLPPTVRAERASATAETEGDGGARDGAHSGVKLTLFDTLFERLLRTHGASRISRMLTTQYRMHERIMAFPCSALYDGRLVAAETVRTRLLPDLAYPVDDTDDTREPVIFYDTQGGDFSEQSDADAAADGSNSSLLLADSKSNPGEAALAAAHVRRLVAAGLAPADIAVVTPYNAQTVALARQLPRDTFPGLEIGSVDGFQGREKEAVVVTLVRSNGLGEVGFLAEKRRLNVAMTRARRHLCVCGDGETVAKGGEFLKKWMEFLESVDLRYPDSSEYV